MSRIIIIITLISLSKFTLAQKITYNYLVDTSNIEVKKVQTLFENYIHSRPDSNYKNPYWSEEEKKSPYHFDILYGEFQPSLYMGFPIHVLSIKSNNGLYEIKAMFSSCKDEGYPYVLCIATYYAKIENGTYKLFNALFVNRKKWHNSKIGFISFYYPLYHRFDTAMAIKTNNFVTELCNNLHLKPKPFEYYFADDYDELETLKGMDYWIGKGGEVKPTGLGGNGRVFCSGEGEHNFHEPFHILVDTSYKGHLWVAEGMATYLGGCRGQTLSWHIQRTNAYLKKHSEINLNDLLVLRTIDEYTDYRYVLGGLIAKKIYEKGGWNLIRQFMKSGYSDNDYYNAIEKYLGIKRNDLNKYLRQELEIEANR